ncbi:dihydroorotate dehydrogenase electron transfer subunit [Metabacillus sp. GX 13764]|uniref:dihydroorotate dehydrogenase electron transfer subunit n=1 Tax=Metabacillus kandeliae TaxID=2900151 RepID=UPI001E64AD86|nr:dihydroorotate dehydrogenase electron transfer subunit [Metabacillus kandeliae]MCD7033860.1 dihydroorotate dehydrogenase electron transfer subunit [Metabacillus kandeliae]
MIINERMEIRSHQEIADRIFEMTLKGELVSFIQKPGQFVHVKVSDSYAPLLRRPISISHYSKEKGEMVLLYRSDGEGTALLSKKQPGDSVQVLGPLGNGFNPDIAAKGKRVLLAGGGIGVPPLFGLAMELNKRSIDTVSVLGFQNRDDVFYEDAFQKESRTIVATADGSYGTEGFITDAINDYELDFDILFACGPTPMLSALKKQFSDKEVYLSLEERMGCGIGACFACVCHVPDSPSGYVKICSDGPVFKAEEVVI